MYLAKQQALLDDCAPERSLDVPTVLAPTRREDEHEGERKEDSSRSRSRGQNLERNPDEEDEECSICLEELDSPNRIVGIFRTECGHLFHSMCFFVELNRKKKFMIYSVPDSRRCS